MVDKEVIILNPQAEPFLAAATYTPGDVYNCSNQVLTFGENISKLDEIVPAKIDPVLTELINEFSRSGNQSLLRRIVSLKLKNRIQGDIHQTKRR